MQPAAAGAPSEAAIVDDIRAQEDATILKNRVWIENEFNNNHDGATANELTLGLRLGWRISDNHDIALQIEQLFNRNTSQAAGDDPVEQGVGDLKVTLGTAVRLSPTVRIGGGVELRMPVGDDQVSANIWRLQEFAALAWDATPWLTLTPKVRYFHTIGRQDGASPQNYWEIYAPATFILPHHWSLTTRYEIKIDQISEHTTHSAKFTIGRQISRPALGLSAALKVPFNSLSNDYQLVFNMTLNF